MNIEYFKGKPCSIITITTNRNFKEENPETYLKQISNYYLGFVTEIDSKWLYLKQLGNEQMTAFNLEHIVGIAEEQMVDAESEEGKKVIDELKSIKENAAKKMKEKELEINSSPSNSNFVDIKKLNTIAEQLKYESK